MLDTDQYADARKELIMLSQAGKLDADTLKAYPKFNDIIKELGYSAEETESKMSDMIDEINQLAENNAVDYLDNYSQGIANLETAYGKFKNQELIDAGTLNQLQGVFGDLDSFQEFQNAVTSGETELQEYFDNIVTEYAKTESAIGDLTEANKEWTIQQLISAGITEDSARTGVEQALKQKASIEERVADSIRLLNANVAQDETTKELAISTANLKDITQDEAVALLKTANASDTAAQSLALYMWNKKMAEGYDLNNPSDLNYLINLAKYCGVAANELGVLTRAKAKLATAESWKANADNIKDSVARAKALANASKMYDEASKVVQDGFDKISDKALEFDYKTNLEFSYSGALDPDGNGAGADAKDDFKNLLDDMLDMLDKALAAGKMDLKDYLNQSQALIEQYYRDGKISAADYWNYIAELRQKTLDIYDKVINAVTRQIEKQKKQLEDQKSAIEEYYNSQIEEIEKKKDALQDENDEIDKNMQLQKSQYALNRALSQRTKLIYSESRGFHYEADWDAVDNARENLRKAQTDKINSEYEKSIKSLQEAMKKETDEIDKQIEELDEYGQKWANIAQDIQDAIEDQYAAQVLGSNWTEQILDRNIDLLNNFTEDYKRLYQEQADAAYNAAKAQVDAANMAANATGGTGGTGGKGGADNSNKEASWYRDGKGEDNHGYKLYQNGKEIGNYKTQTDAQHALQDKVEQETSSIKAQITSLNTALSKAPTSEKLGIKAQIAELQKKRDSVSKQFQIKGYFLGTDSAKSGTALVGELGSEIILNKNGTASIVTEPTIVKMQGGEKVFNAEETSRILNGSKYSPLSSYDPKKFKMLNAFANGTSSAMQNAIATQAVSIASGISKGYSPYSATNNGGATVNNTFNVSLPNITDASKATDLIREFEALTMKGMQYFNS